MAEDGFDRVLWDGYAPLFAQEEDVVFPRDHAEESFYANLRMERPGPCLELGAGHGRLTRALKGEHALVALEPSESMLKLWSRSARKRALRIRGLAEEIPLVNGSFSLILFPYNGYHCILQRELRLRALREVGRTLKPAGRFVMETCPFLAARPEERRALRYDRRELGGVRLVEDVYQDLERDLVIFDMEYAYGDGRTTRLVLELARLCGEQILGEIEEAGMTVVDVWGDYDRSPWEADSPRMLILTR